MTAPASTVVPVPDRGAALVVVLVAVLLVASIGLGLVALSSTERAVAFNYQVAVEGRHAAEAVLERALVDVRRAADTTAVVSGAIASTFTLGGVTPVTPAGRALDLVEQTAALQADVDVGRWGADAPVWRLFAYGPIAGLGTGGEVPSVYHGVVWIADDPADADGNPLADTNDVAILHARSFGPGRAQHDVTATIERRAGALIVRRWEDR